jgi:hypothetical protein
MFNSEGETPVTIGKIVPSDPRFNTADPNAFDVNIQVTGEDGATDYVPLQFSSDYGKGNFADRTQTQISYEALRKLGYESEDLSPLFFEGHPLEGKKAVVMVKASKPTEDGKVFYNPKYFVGGGRTPEAISPDVVKARMAALMAGGANAPATNAPAQGASTPAEAANNPFAKSKQNVPSAAAKTAKAKSPFG